MEQRIAEQGWQFLMAGGLGVSLALVYDLLWGLRQELGWVTALADLLIGLWLLLGNLLLLVYVGDGEYRIFFPVGIAAGYGLWRVTVKRAVRGGSRALWRVVLWIPRKIWCFLKKFIKKRKNF